MYIVFFLFLHLLKKRLFGNKSLRKKTKWSSAPESKFTFASAKFYWVPKSSFIPISLKGRFQLSILDHFWWIMLFFLSFRKTNYAFWPQIYPEGRNWILLRGKSLFSARVTFGSMHFWTFSNCGIGRAGRTDFFQCVQYIPQKSLLYSTHFQNLFIIICMR